MDEASVEGEVIYSSMLFSAGDVHQLEKIKRVRLVYKARVKAVHTATAESIKKVVGARSNANDQSFGC